MGRLEGTAGAAAHGSSGGVDVTKLVDESQPLLPQVVRLKPADYLAWIAAPSTGHPVMFANPLMERMTCTMW